MGSMEFKISAAAFTQDSLEQTLSPSKLPNELSLLRQSDDPEPRPAFSGVEFFRYNRMTAMDATRMRMISSNEVIKSFCFVSKSQNFLDLESEKDDFKSFSIWAYLVIF